MQHLKLHATPRSSFPQKFPVYVTSMPLTLRFILRKLIPRRCTKERHPSSRLLLLLLLKNTIFTFWFFSDDPFESFRLITILNLKHEFFLLLEVNIKKKRKKKIHSKWEKHDLLIFFSQHLNELRSHVKGQTYTHTLPSLLELYQRSAKNGKNGCRTIASVT